MESASIERRLAAIVAMDVVGYSRLMGIDERATLRSLKAHRAELIEPAVAAHHGRVVKSTGDGLLLEFASVVDAIGCGVDIQRGMQRRNIEVPEARRIVFRVGVNIGDIIVDAGDIFGDGVNVAARLETLCEPGGICISSAANEQVRDKLDLSFSDLGEHLVKNITRAVKVFGLSSHDIALLPDQPKPATARSSGSRRRWKLGAIAAGIACVIAVIGAGWWSADRRGMFDSGDLDRRVADALARYLPEVSEKNRAEIVGAYLKSGKSRVLAIAPRAGKSWRTAGWPNGDAARERGLERCQQYYNEPCVLAAVDDSIVPPSPDKAATLWDMPRIRYEGPFDVARIPGLRDNDLQRMDVTGYRNAKGPKAAAFHADGILRIVYGALNQNAAEEQVLQACNNDSARRAGTIPCVLYASGDRVVLTMRATAPITAAVTITPPRPAVTQPLPAENSTSAALSAAIAKLLPALSEQARGSHVLPYLQDRQHKAMAVFPTSATWRTSAWGNAAVAEERTLEGCQLRHGGPCVLVAVNDNVRSPPADGNWPQRDMPKLAYAGEYDLTQLPIVGETVRSRLDVAGYRVQAEPKAAAIHPVGRMVVVTGAVHQRAAEQKALEDCNVEVQRAGSDSPCYLYAAGDRVVIGQRATSPVTSVPKVKPPAHEPKTAPPEDSLSLAIAAALAKAAPSLSEQARATTVTAYLSDRAPKAIAVFPPSAIWRVSTSANAGVAEERALEACQLRYGGPCILIAVNETIQSPSDGSWPRRDMPRPVYEGRFEIRQIPIVSDAARRRSDVTGYLAQKGAKAVAIHPNGRLIVIWGAANQREAEQRALSDCNADGQRTGRDAPCYLYAIGDQVVLRQRSTEPLTALP